jgi:hypothetical protein
LPTVARAQGLIAASASAAVRQAVSAVASTMPRSMPVVESHTIMVAGTRGNPNLPLPAQVANHLMPATPASGRAAGAPPRKRAPAASSSVKPVLAPFTTRPAAVARRVSSTTA